MKILIFTKNWLGDTLFQFPAIEAIQERYPEAHIICAAPRRCREILEAHPAVAGVWVFDEKQEHRAVWKRLAFVWRLRREGFAQAYLFHRSRTRAFLAWAAGIPERIGYGAKRSWLLTQAVPEPVEPMHQVDYFLNLLRQADIPTNRSAYRFYFPETAREAVQHLLLKHGLKSRSYVCFHLGANWEPKRWPVAHFASLADAIHEKWHLPVVVTGAPNDLALAQEFQKQVKRASIAVLTGQTTLQELGALFEQALVLITGDSGPMHIASGVGCPVVAIFGPTDPHLTGPRGTGECKILSYVPPGYEIPWLGRVLPEDGWLRRIQPILVMAALEEINWLNRHIGPAPAMHTQTETSQKTGHGNVVQILLVTLSNIGDVILTTPVLMSLVKRFPAARITVVCGPRAEGILKGSRYVDRLILYDKHSGLRGKKRFLSELRKVKYDWVVDLRNTAIPWLVSARKRSPLFRRLTAASMRERHLEVLRKMGVNETRIQGFDFYGYDDEKRLMQKIRAFNIPAERGWILVAPAAASELKTWPLENFRQLITRLLAVYPQDILLIGDSREGKIAEPLVSVNPARIFNLAGKTTLREAAALIARSALLVANDSAVMHMGFELNKPVVAIFGPTDPAQYGREGAHFRVVRSAVLASLKGKTIHRGDRDFFFRDLTVEEVYQACQEVIPAGFSLTLHGKCEGQ